MPALMILLKPTTWLLIAVAVLGIMAGTFYKLWQHEVRSAAAARVERDDAIAQGKVCSQAVEKLRREGDDRQKRAELALRVAQAQRDTWQKKAMETMQIQPADPKNLCASADVLNKQKLEERRAKPDTQ